MIRPKVSNPHVLSRLCGRIAARPLFLAIVLFSAMLFAPKLFAAEPTLTTVESAPLPLTMQENSVKTFTLQFKDSDNDRITKSVMTLKTPQGTATLPGKVAPGDTAAGVYVNWDIKASGAGEYIAFFTVTGADGNTARYPAEDGDPYKFVVQNPLIQWGIFGGGVLVGLFFLPFLVYALSRSMNQRGDPTKAARGALLLGILMCGGLFIWLFAGAYGPLAFGIGIIGALALIVMVLTRK